MTSGARIIRAKYAGKCYVCGKRFPEGTRILWMKDVSVSRTFCSRACYETFAGIEKEPTAAVVEASQAPAPKPAKVKRPKPSPSATSGRWCLGCGLPKEECGCDG